MTAGRINQVRTLLQPVPWSHLARITAHVATWYRGCVCGCGGGGEEEEGGEEDGNDEEEEDE